MVKWGIFVYWRFMPPVKNLRLCNKCLLIADGSDSVCLPQRGKVAQPIFILVVTDEVWCKIILHFCYAK